MNAQEVACRAGEGESPGNGQAEEKAGNPRGHVITWALSVLSACIVGWAWIHTHPTPSFVTVDVNALVKAETGLLAQAVKPDATKEQQEAAIRRASEFGKKLDDAIARLTAECGCVVVNAAAIVAQPANMPVRDATQRVKVLVSQQ